MDKLPKRPTQRQVKEAARVLALDYIYSVSEGDRQSFPNKINGALDLWNDEAANSLHELVWRELEKLEKQWPLKT